MNKVFLCGDIHGHLDIFKLNSALFPEGRTLDKTDYVIILGDFGLCWDESKEELYWLNWLNEKPWTTLFIDGNHENFDKLLSYPIEEWNGGKVSFLRSSVIHLHRGCIFNICGKTFFTMGGNHSHDIYDGILEIDDPRIHKWNKENKMFRINHYSWWKEEVPSASERGLALKNLELYNNKVDYILTHGLPVSALCSLFRFGPDTNEYELWLQENISQKIDYKEWYSGHYHIDKRIDNKHMSLYDKVIRII